MEKTLKFHGLWMLVLVLVWILIIGMAIIDILFGSSSRLDFLTIILGILMICRNYDNQER